MFNAHFEFVEFELQGTAIERREVAIPNELMALAVDDDTRRLLKTSFRLVDNQDALSGKHLQDLKARIARAFLKPLPGYGQAVLRAERAKFEEEIELLSHEVEKFQDKVGQALGAMIDKRREALKAALLPRLVENPPKNWTRADGSKADPKLIEQWTDHELRRAFSSVGRLVGEMKVRVVFKGVTYDLLQDPRFIELARRAMPTLDKLYAEWEATRALPAERHDDVDRGSGRATGGG